MLAVSDLLAGTTIAAMLSGNARVSTELWHVCLHTHYTDQHEQPVIILVDKNGEG